MRFTISFIILFAFWILLSGNFDAFHLTLGVISTLVVTFWTGDMLVIDSKLPIGARLALLWRFTLYTLWLLWQIVIANFHVVYVALHPKMDDILEPQMVEFKTELKTDLAKFVLANSITLTPGTVTVRIEDGVFLIHALTDHTAAGVPGDMEKRIQQIFERNHNE
tara:strand:- start:112 stop:606 length:495 start_codon:yes stop_codon:yes gene_type:complete